MQTDYTAFGRDNFGETHFSKAQLGDKRRTKRLVSVANTLIKHPGGTLPEKLKGPGELDGLYHLMKQDEVTHQAILAPHIAFTLDRISQRTGATLIIHDTTELDFTSRRTLKKLGQIGNGHHKGYLCHNSLAVDPAAREVIGLTSQILHRRPRVSKKETHAQRRKRANRESLLWLSGVRNLPASKNLIDVCDRGADSFEFLEHSLRSGRRFVIRSGQDRAIYTGPDAEQHTMLYAFVRTLSPIAEKTHHLPTRTLIKKPKKKGSTKEVRREQREAVLNISAAYIYLRPPRKKHGNHGNERLGIWVIRVWEPNPPAGEDPLEWFLFTNHVIAAPRDALEVVGWYESRWMIEEFHKAKKTGCRIEDPQFQSEDRLEPMIALLSVTALTLLNLRELARRPDAKERPAKEVISADYVELLCAWRHKRVKPNWSIQEFCFALARLGGHLNRKCDGMPGWLTLWRGWHVLQAMLDGARVLMNQQKCA